MKALQRLTTAKSRDATRNASTCSYDAGSKPFTSDALRGRWSRPVDFVFSCANFTFCSAVFSELPVHAFCLGGVYFLPAYVSGLFLISITVFSIQTFLGQFSTSGSISVFRVSPIFKGIGYCILLLNLVSLTFYSVIAAVPFYYAISSFRSKLPWMHCNQSWNSPNCSIHNDYDEEKVQLDPHATVEFFHSVIRSADISKSDFTISWQLFCSMGIVWVLVTAVMLQEVQFIGKLFRCTSILMIVLFFSICVCIWFQAQVSWEELKSFFVPQLGFYHKETIVAAVKGAASMQTLFLGPGWGSVLTLASYNTFRHDSHKLTTWVIILHLLVFFAAIVCGRIAWDHFENHVGLFIYHFDEEHHLQFLYLCFGYLLGSLPSLPNLWSFLFFAMIFIAELGAMIIQMMSVLTAVFDEHEKTRARKTALTFYLTVFLFCTSIYFCTKSGFKQVHVMPLMTTITHFIISLVVVLMTTWVYGRLRLQRDLQFMLGRTISKYKLALIRFISPGFLILAITTFGFIIEMHSEASSTLVITLQSSILVVAPIYMIYKFLQTTGQFKSRIKQCLEPQDWQPVDSHNRRYYEEIMGNTEMLVINDDYT